MSELRTIERWKQKSRHLKIEIYALYLAYRDPRVPWYAKAFVALVVGYALKMIPEKVMKDCSIRSKEVMSKKSQSTGQPQLL